MGVAAIIIPLFKITSFDPPLLPCWQCVDLSTRGSFSERCVCASSAIKSILHAYWENAQINETPYHVFIATLHRGRLTHRLTRYYGSYWSCRKSCSTPYLIGWLCWLCFLCLTVNSHTVDLLMSVFGGSQTVVLWVNIRVLSASLPAFCCSSLKSLFTECLCKVDALCCCSATCPVCSTK